MASYGAVIEVSVKGQNALEQLESSARKIQSLFNNISAQRNIFDQSVGSTQTRQLKKNLENLVASFAAAKDGARQFKITVDGQERTVNMYSKTLAGLNSQLNTFNSIANNAAVGTNQYSTAIQSANKVTNEFLRVQAKALGVATDFSRMNVQSALDLGKTIPSSIDGLNFYKSALENVLGTVKIGSNDFRVLEEAIAEVDERISSSRLKGQSSTFTLPSDFKLLGPASPVGLGSQQQRFKYAQQVADLEYKQLVTGQQIVQAKLKENQVEELQNRLAQASNALAENDLALAKRLTNELRSQRIAYERKNRAAEALMRPTSMVAGAAESVTGKRPFGQPPVPGSPAALQAVSSAQTSTQATQQLGASIDLRKRLNNLTTSAAILEQKIIQYRSKGITISSDLAEIDRAILAVKDTSTDLDKKKLDYLDLLLNGLRNELLLRKAIAKTQATPAQPSGTKKAGAPQQQVGAGAKTAGNVILGAGFPLLFGGGPGAVLGGALGGFAPGPLAFAAQIGLSALGQALDKFGVAAIEAGTAIGTLDKAITHMTDKSIFASKQQAFIASQLQEYGRFSLAASVAQERLNQLIGAEGVRNLQNLGTETQKLNIAWATFSLNLQSMVSGPLTAAIQLINAVLQGPQEKTGINTPGTYVGRSGLLGGPVPRATKTPAAAIKLSDEQIATNIASARTLYTELADLERDLNNKKRQYAEQYTDMVLALTRQQYDLTEQLQRKAFDTQVQALQKELELLERQAQIRIEISRNALRGQQLSAAPGADLETSLMSAIEEYRIRRKEIDNESGNRERQFKLEMLRLDVENERYKLDIAKTIQRTNYDNAVRIARINEEINRQNETVSRLNYKRRADIISTELAVTRSQTLQLYAQADAALKQSNLTKDDIAYFTTLRDGLVTALKATKEAQAKQEAGKLFNIPGQLPGMKALPNLSMNTSALDAANKSLQQRITAYLQLEQTQKRANDEEAARLELLAQLDELATTSISGIIKGQNDQIRQQRLYTAEIKKGTTTALAEELTQIRNLYEPTVTLLNLEIEKLEIKKEANGLDKEALDLLNALKDRRDRLNVTTSTAVALAKQQAEPDVRLQKAITDVQGELNDLTDSVNVAVNGARAIGDAFTESFKGIISGAMTAQEALANFFQNVADRFLDMAAQIIAKWIQMTILNSILKLFPGGGAMGGGLEARTPAGNAAFMDRVAGLDLAGRATGGPVSAGTPYMVGERGPELFVPGRSGTIVPNDQMGGSKVEVGSINISVENTGESLSAQAQKQIANQVQGIVMATLVNERRSGGVLR